MNNYKIAQRIKIFKLASENKKILKCNQVAVDKVYFKDSGDNLYALITRLGSKFKQGKEYVVTFEIKEKKSRVTIINILSYEDYTGQEVTETSSEQKDIKKDEKAAFNPPESLLIAYIKLLAEKGMQEIVLNSDRIIDIKKLLDKAKYEDLKKIEEAGKNQKIKEIEEESEEESEIAKYYNEMIVKIHSIFINAIESYVNGEEDPLANLIEQIKIS